MKEALGQALKWWEDVRYETVVVGGDEYNVFDDEPVWVAMAKKAIAEAPVPVPTLTDKEIHRGKVLLKTQMIHLTQGDVDDLDADPNHRLRVDSYDNYVVRDLYEIWKSL